MPLLDTAGARIACRKIGPGLPLLLSHSWSLSGLTFPVERARAVPAQFPDFRGILARDRARVFVHKECPQFRAEALIAFFLS